MKKKISAVLAAAVVLLSITSCSKTNDGSENEPINNSAGVLYETWKDIDRDKVIAHIEGADSEKFDITFGEFYSEYLYYLISYNIDDDMSAAYKDACETYREDIITYLTFERIFLQVAEEKGCGLSSLTDEEKTQIETNVQATIDNFTSNYTATATEELGEGASQSEILNRSTELLVADLQRAELTTDVFKKWETNSYIQEKLAAELGKDITVSDDEVEAMFNEYVEIAKTALREDKISYESDNTLTWIYIPEGTRLADQILVAFDKETQEAIKAARSAGNDEEAERLRNEAYNDEMKKKVDGIIALIDGGTSFDDLQATYNEDTSDEPTAVIVDSELYVSEFYDAVFSIEEIGGIAEPTVSDYGVHIIKYAGDAEVTEEDKADIFKSMKEFLFAQKENEIQQNAYEEWLEIYPYTIDYDLLQITVDADENGETEE